MFGLIVRSRFKLCVSIIALCFLPNAVFPQSTQNINVLFINEANNELAAQAVDIALSYIKKNPILGLSVQLQTVPGNRDEPDKFHESICSYYMDAVKKDQPPHVVLDTTITGVTSEIVKSFSSALGLPTVSASVGQEGYIKQWRELDEKKRNYLLQVMPPIDIIPEVIRPFIKFMNISNAAILHDETFVMDHKYNALLQNIPTRHVIFPIAAPSERAQQIESLRNLDINNFFILGSLTSIRAVLEAAKEEYFERNFAWHAITSNVGRLKCDCKNVTIIFLHPAPNLAISDRLRLMSTIYNSKRKPEVMSVYYFDLAMRTFLSVKSMQQSGEWPTSMEYISCDDFDGTNSPDRNIDLRTAFVNVHDTPISGKFTFPPANMPFNGNSWMKFKMDISAVSVQKGITISTKPLGNWMADISAPIHVNSVREMSNLTAAQVYRVLTVVQAPFVMKDENSPKGFKGYCIDLLDEIAKLVNFEYVIEEVADKKIGKMNQQGEWSGLIRQLIDKKADIALAAISVMAERETVIDYTIPYYEMVGITILMQLPSTPRSLFRFLTVLETNVWLCILAAYVFTSFLMWIFDRYSPYSSRNNLKTYVGKLGREFSLKESLWFCMTSLTPQGGCDPSKCFSGTIVVATWWLFGFIIISSYTANLAAFLTVSRLDTPIASLDDLSKQYKISYAPLNGSPDMTYFERMARIEGRFHDIWKKMALNDSLTPFERSKLAVWEYPLSDKYTKLWQAMQKTGMPKTLNEAVARVRNSTPASGFAFIGDATDIRYLEMINCDLQVVGDEFSRKPYALAVQQGSPLKDDINNALVHMLNKRYLEKLKAVWWNSEVYKSKCAKATDQSEGISIQNIGGVFILILVGIGMACVTLIYEYCVYKYQKAPKTQVESSKTGLASIGRRYVRDSTEKSIKLRRRKTNLPTSFRTLKIHNR